MRIIVFGASGKIGRRVVSRLLERGHEVTAFVHRSNPFTESGSLHIFHGDIHSPEDVDRALQGGETVVSTLSSWRSKRKDVLSSAMASIIPAMERASVRRIISLTGSDARVSADQPRWWQRIAHGIFSKIARGVMADAEDHVRLLETSGLKWTIVRSPVMRSFGPKGRPQLSPKPPAPWHSVHRDDVATVIVDLVTTSDCVSASPHVQ